MLYQRIHFNDIMVLCLYNIIQWWLIFKKIPATIFILIYLIFLWNIFLSLSVPSYILESRACMTHPESETYSYNILITHSTHRSCALFKAFPNSCCSAALAISFQFLPQLQISPYIPMFILSSTQENYTLFPCLLPYVSANLKYVFKSLLFDMIVWEACSREQVCA